MKTLHGTEDATLFIQGGTGGIGAGLVTYALANFSWKKSLFLIVTLTG